MLIDWVKITLTWVTHTVITLGSDLFDAQSVGRLQKFEIRLWKTRALMTHYWISDFHRREKPGTPESETSVDGEAGSLFILIWGAAQNHMLEVN